LNTKQQKLIGVVGGMGPLAGIDLVQKIFNQTNAKYDQHHLPVSMLSIPQSIPDRTEFLLGKTSVNPAQAIADIICALNKQGASVIGMPCNTAHAAPIFSEIMSLIPSEIKLIHMVQTVANYIKVRFPSVVKVGILSTTGTFISNVYPECLSHYGLIGVQVLEEIQQRYIHPAIYSPNYGLKAYSVPVKSQATKGLYKGIDYLLEQGVEVIILGCTEIPIALSKSEIKGVPLIDTSKVLARALIMESAPEALLEVI
jgi:aspartate racemase